jgi:hypothetical protein
MSNLRNKVNLIGRVGNRPEKKFCRGALRRATQTGRHAPRAREDNGGKNPRGKR